MRKLLTLLLLAAAALVGVVLLANVRESRLFRLSAPVAPMPSVKESLREGSQTTSLTTVSTSTLLEAPRYTGQDAEGRHWEITAATAGQQGSAASTTLVLTTVSATLEIEGSPAGVPEGEALGRRAGPPESYTLHAATGTYQQSENLLNLQGEVQATGRGLTFTAPAMQADIATRNLRATGGTQLTGRLGNWNMRIEAPTLQAENNGGTVTLTGGVKANLTPAKE